jgi:hypothetical protein
MRHFSLFMYEALVLVWLLIISTCDVLTSPSDHAHYDWLFADRNAFVCGAIHRVLLFNYL